MRRRIRKFAHKEQSNNQTENSSKTETTLLLCGSSGERANNIGDSTIKEEVRRRKMRKFADRQTKNNQAKNSSNTEATLILCGSSGERANNRGDTTITEEDEEKN